MMREIINIRYNNYTKHINAFYDARQKFFVMLQQVTRTYHSVYKA